MLGVTVVARRLGLPEEEGLEEESRWSLEDRLAPSPDNRLSSHYTMQAASSRWTTTPARGPFAMLATSIQRAPCQYASAG
jgi:hypothetical protein